MEDINLLKVCLNAFVAVLGLLSLLALLMRGLITLFPKQTPASDAVVASAIRQAVDKAIPGARVIRIEPLQ